MSETNGDGVFDLGDGLAHFRAGGTEFGLDVIEANERMDRIAEETKDAPGLAPHLTAFAAWLEEKTQSVKLTPGQADDLWQKVRELYVQKKRRQAERLAALQTSPTSSPA